MGQIKTVALSGLGAVGAMYAAKILDHKPKSLSIIADSERISRYKKDGVLINGKNYPFVYTEPGKGTPCDLVIIAVKQHHLEKTMDEIESFVGKDTVILSLLNGISSEEILSVRFGQEKLVYSFVIGTDSVRSGTSISYIRSGEIVFGIKKDDPATDKLKYLSDFFSQTDIASRIPDDILREQWWKFMMNVGINQTSAILRAPYGVFKDISEARATMKAASREVIAIAQKAGIDLHPDDIDKYVKVIETLSSEGKTSMLQDVEAGRKTEVEIFAGTVISLGEEYGVATPVNETMYNLIKAIERMNGIDR
jgi:2-dehydropantoate 2-reductase